MGGNALHNCKTRRFQRDEYFRLEDEVIQKLNERFPQNKCLRIKTYQSKESFGDMDLIFESNQSVDWNTTLTDLFNSKEIVRNGHVWSFEYKEIQVDLILTTTSKLETSQFYFQYSDMNNLVGRIAHKLGFKFGHMGLNCIIKDGDYQFAELEVSKDLRKIYEFLGYDYDRYLKGFNELEDIFEFVASSKYFHKEIYLLHNRNHKSRIRDRKRKTYAAFLDWCEAKTDFINAYQWDSFEELGGRVCNEGYMNIAFEAFPDFKEKYEVTMIAFEKARAFKELYNGTIVMKITGLEGKELGAFMKSFKETIEREDEFNMSLQDFVLNKSNLLELYIENFVEYLAYVKLDAIQ